MSTVRCLELRLFLFAIFLILLESKFLIPLPLFITAGFIRGRQPRSFFCSNLFLRRFIVGLTYKFLLFPIPENAEQYYFRERKTLPFFSIFLFIELFIIISKDFHSGSFNLLCEIYFF